MKRTCPYCMKDLEDLEESEHFLDCSFYDHDKTDWSKFAGRGEK